jgi:ferredoxin
LRPGNEASVPVTPAVDFSVAFFKIHYNEYYCSPNITFQEGNFMAKKPVVDQELCTSCGVCVDLCPGVFQLNDDDLAEVTDPFGASEEEIQEAIDQCPVACITWDEE